MSLDYQALAQKALRPNSPEYERAQPIIKEANSLQEAWETLAFRGIIPQDWTETPRRFLADFCPECGRQGMERPSGGGTKRMSCDSCGGKGAPLSLRYPVTQSAMLTFASDPEGITRAENLAIEALSRLSIFGVEAPLRCFWRTTRRDLNPSNQRREGTSENFKRLYEFVPAWLRRSANIGEDTSALMSEINRTLEGPIAQDAYFAALWSQAQEKRYVVPASSPQYPVPEKIAGQRFADLPDPFVPIMEIWSLGYIPDSLIAAGVVLTAPEIPNKGQP